MILVNYLLKRNLAFANMIEDCLVINVLVIIPSYHANYYIFGLIY